MLGTLREEVKRLETQDYAMLGTVLIILALAWYQFLTGLPLRSVTEESQTIFIISGLFDLVLLLFILNLLLHLHRIERRIEGEVEAVEAEVSDIEDEVEAVEAEVHEVEAEVKAVEREVEQSRKKRGKRKK